MRIADSKVELSSAKHYSKSQSYRASKEFTFLGFGGSGTEGSGTFWPQSGQSGDSYQKAETENIAYAFYGAGGRLMLDEEQENQENLQEETIDANLDGLSNMSSVASGVQNTTLSAFEEIWENFRIRLLQLILNMLSESYGADTSSIADAYADKYGSSGTSLSPGTMLSQVTYTQEYSYVETEAVSFQGKGIALTEDGREIEFDISMSMSRSFASYTKLQQTGVVNMCDPLVINVGSGITEISEQKFYFDLDCDGMEDRISMLCEDAGFLALDKDGNGVIDDGSELFGTKSGDGFADLAAYDEDGNGWIDENDSVWTKLKVWMKKEDGQDQLLTLENTGVGAINLGNADTQYAEYDSKGNVTGMVRKTGFFLYENGGAGLLHHIDLAKD